MTETSEQCGLTEDRVPLQISKKAIRDKAMLVFSPGGWGLHWVDWLPELPGL